MRYLLLITLCLLPLDASARLYIDVHGGGSFSSPYRYLDSNEPAIQKWISFDEKWGLSGGVKIGLDIYRESFRFGVYGGFSARYNVARYEKDSSGAIQREPLGEMFSLPILFYFEHQIGPFHYELGLGPFITRTNFVTGLEPAFTVEGYFGYVFAVGYQARLNDLMSLVFRLELLLNMPVELPSYLPASLQKSNTDYQKVEYNVLGFPYLFFNVQLTIGLRFHLAPSLRIPLEKWLPSWKV